MNRVSLLRQMCARIGTWWPAKMISTTVGMTVFFVAYFWVQKHPLFTVTPIPLTLVDRMIGFHPEAFLLYASLWIYVSLVPALLIDRREFISYWVADLAISVIGLGIFFVWPTTAIWSDADWSQYPAFSFLKSVDAASNACPSLHVTFAVFSAFWLHRLLLEMGAGRTMRALNWLWCFAILYSTIAVRQHSILDVCAGAAFGIAAAVIQLRLLPAAATYRNAVT